MAMQLNTRLDQSLDDIIKEDRKQRSTKGTKAKAATKPRAKLASAKKTAVITGRPARRVKNKVTAISTSDLGRKASKNGIAARLGTTALKASSGRVASGRVGSMAGRVGKANRVETALRSAGAADKKKKAADLRSRISKVAEQKKASNISIKGEAGPATIFISNLDTDASAEDVKICFKQFGAIKDCTLLYDHTGKASGHAEVTFSSKAAAEGAAAKLNNVLADGRRLSVRILPASQSRVSQRPAQTQQVQEPRQSNPHYSSSRKVNRKQNRRSGGGGMDID
ncbi:hypothetical protein GGF39_003070 [Coemansia sp. RSA 1721]|nr:hypothetical protein GGF39_003070 [Coemansia sp. RSA 1721]